MTEPSLILVVDDQDAARFAKAQLLRRHGFRVEQAATGADALAIAGERRPDLVLLDVNLPDISGIEISRRLRTNDAVPPVQILQISSTAIKPADRVRGLEGGADAYLTEPIEPEVLIATVNAMLRARRAEAALVEALAREKASRAEAEEANRQKDEFLATLSHELRTPLNAAMGWLSMIRRGGLSEEAQGRALESVERNTRLQAELIGDILDVTRIAKGKLHLTMRVVDLGEVARAAIESAGAASRAKRQTIEVTASRALVYGDRGRLHQVVTNLVSNAVQFTPEGGAIAVSAGIEGRDAVVRVADTGAGIAPDALPHVFEQFRQVGGGLSRKHGGLGLGLSVVRLLVELHDGTVDVTSEGVGHGAVFTVRLPAEPDETADESDAGPPLLAGVSVLVVNGDGTSRDAIVAALEGSGASVVAAPSASSGRDAAAGAAFDVIVTSAVEPLGPVTIALPSRVARFGGGGADAAGQQRVSLQSPVRPSAIVREIARGVRTRERHTETRA